ncbi:hypothetical protein B4110_3313 [Parageobacillus toebii]|uniref:PH domain-containing protein n=1 Tax=Parageobacillus toebii TaxID=153151 RepID=A0A150N8J8_9BACL|nr:hypothetical protein B4110_3313 [Parageobacillus toebii]
MNEKAGCGSILSFSIFRSKETTFLTGLTEEEVRKWMK